MGAILDRFDVTINGQTGYEAYTDIDNFNVTHTPDTMARTATLRIIENDQFYESGNDIAVGHKVIIRAYSEQVVGSLETIAVGTIIDKIVPEDGGAYIEINITDDLYRLDRCFIRFSINSKTITKDLYLFFKDDGSGSGGPGQYVRKAELRELVGSDYFIPFEDMDAIPLHSLRRKKDGERSIYINFNEYEIQYQKKELVFRAAQVDPDDNANALPDQDAPAPDGWFTGSTADLGTDQDWTYRAVASFFVNPDYPTRNTDDTTIENLMRDRVFVGTQQSETGGCGYTSSQLNLTFSYTKGAAVTIRDRHAEGMRVSAYTPGSSDITVSDGDAWTGVATLYYYDTQGAYQEATISSILGDVLTLSASPPGMVAGIRVYGGNQLGIVVAISHANASMYKEIANFTDVVIDGTTYFIREVRSNTSLVLVNANENGDFSGLGASGDMTYPTIEYTGLQIRRLNWDKDKGSVGDLIQFCYDNQLLPINYFFQHIPHVDIIRGRLDRQYKAEVSAVAGAVLTVDDVDGFYPGQRIAYYDTTDSVWREATISTVDYGTVATPVEKITLTAAPTNFASGTIYADCKIAYRQQSCEHSISLEDAFCRCEIVSTTNAALPLLNPDLTSTLAAAPAGSWTITGDADNMVDDKISTMFLLQWQDTGAGLVEGDPEEWGMTPLPWEIARWDMGQLEPVSKVMLQVGYTADTLEIAQDGYLELPLLTVEGCAEDVALGSADKWSPVSSKLIAHQFDPRTPNTGDFFFDCDLLTEFRHVRIVVDRPFFYKQTENFFGTPTRNRDVPILNLQLYKRPQIRYTSQDEEVSQSLLSPTDQITPHIGNHPFAQLTDKGAVISAIAGAGPYVLTVPAGHNIIAGDVVEFWDTSAGEPHSGTDSSTTVASVTATSITVPAKPATLAATDEIGALRRWMLDSTGIWRDLLAKNLLASMFSTIQPILIEENESAQNGWDAQTIAVLRLYENLITLRDGTATVLFDPYIRLRSQVITSSLFGPEKVSGLSWSAYEQSLSLRQYNVTAEQIAAGEE